MNTQIFKCHICKVDYAYSEEEDLRMHLIYEHQFYLPNCSTQVAKQSNIDYDKIRKSFLTKIHEVSTRKTLFHNIPKKYSDELSALVKFIKSNKGHCNIQKMEYTKDIKRERKTGSDCFGNWTYERVIVGEEIYDLLSNFVRSKYDDKVWIRTSKMSYGTYKIPDYLRNRFRYKVSKYVVLEDELRSLRNIIYKEGIVI